MHKGAEHSGPCPQLATLLVLTRLAALRYAGQQSEGICYRLEAITNPIKEKAAVNSHAARPERGNKEARRCDWAKHSLSPSWHWGCVGRLLLLVTSVGSWV